MDLGTIIPPIISGSVLLVVGAGIAIARAQVGKVCAGQKALLDDAAAARIATAKSEAQTAEKFAAINRRLDALHADVGELRAVMLNSRRDDR